MLPPFRLAISATTVEKLDESHPKFISLSMKKSGMTTALIPREPCLRKVNKSFMQLFMPMPLSPRILPKS
jgi:hypothetical protein